MLTHRPPAPRNGRQRQAGPRGRPRALAARGAPVSVDLRPWLDAVPPAAAEANRDTWSPQVDGNVIISHVRRYARETVVDPEVMRDIAPA